MSGAEPGPNGGGPIILVTGATDGIGRETARQLTRRGARVLVHGRRAERAAEVVAELRTMASGPNALPLEPVVFDLARLSEVRVGAAELVRRGEPIAVIVHNAGVYMRERVLTEDGFEMTMAVNYLAPFLLTHLMIDSPVWGSIRRIVNVSSQVHRSASLDLDDLGLRRLPFDGYQNYAASKLANVLFTVELARRLSGRDVTVNALHPGVVSTKLLTEGFRARGPDPLAKGAATSVRLALDEDIAKVSGEYFSNGRLASKSPLANDADFVRRLYERTAELVGATPITRTV